MLINYFRMTLFRSICLCASALRFFILFFDSGSLNCFSISSISAFSYLIYFWVNGITYFDELFLFFYFLLDSVFSIGTHLFLHEIILMLDFLNFDEALFIRFVECSWFLAQKCFSHIFRHLGFLLIKVCRNWSKEPFFDR